MGFAAIVIIVHHYLTELMGEPYKIGAIGVDIFMFTMGFGLYFSLYNRTEKTSFVKALPSYFWRRLGRVIPVLALFLIAWGMWKYSNGGFTVKDYFLNLSLTGYWTLEYGKYFNWFISGLLVFYLCSPLIFLFFYKAKYKFIPNLILFVLLSIGVFFMRKNDAGEITRTLIMYVRLIPMTFGMLFGAYCKNPPEKKEKIFTSFFFIIIFAFGCILHCYNNMYWKDSGFTYGLPWYGFGLMTPIICVVFSYFMELVCKITKILSCILSFFGMISFEIYLTHIFIIEYVLIKLNRANNLWFEEPKNFIATFIVSTVFAYALSLISNKISELEKRK